MKTLPSVCWRPTTRPVPHHLRLPQEPLVALGGLFLKALELCRQAGLVKLGHVSLDGTKVKANASKHTVC